MPEKVVMEKSDDFHGLFTFKPLEKGYGVTIGNALRRILLSSLEGYAITGIKIPGVLHEFSTIEGVVEDVAEIILNLKMVRLRKLADNFDSKITVSIKKQKQFKAGDQVTVDGWLAKNGSEKLSAKSVTMNCHELAAASSFFDAKAQTASAQKRSETQGTSGKEAPRPDSSTQKP